MSKKKKIKLKLTNHIIITKNQTNEIGSTMNFWRDKVHWRVNLTFNNNILKAKKNYSEYDFEFLLWNN